MEIIIGNMFSAAFGAGFGAYCAYLLAVRHSDKRKTTRFLALLLLVHEQIAATRNTFQFLETQIVEADEERGVMYKNSIHVPEFSPEQIQFLMEACPDDMKNMPASLLSLKNLCLHANQQIKSEGMTAFSEDYILHILDQMNLEMISCRALYRNLSGQSFPIDSEVFPMKSGHFQD